MGTGTRPGHPLLSFYSLPAGSGTERERRWRTRESISSLLSLLLAVNPSPELCCEAGVATREKVSAAKSAVDNPEGAGANREKAHKGGNSRKTVLRLRGNYHGERREGFRVYSRS